MPFFSRVKKSKSVLYDDPNESYQGEWTHIHRRDSIPRGQSSKTSNQQLSTPANTLSQESRTPSDVFSPPENPGPAYNSPLNSGSPQHALSHNPVSSNFALSGPSVTEGTQTSGPTPVRILVTEGTQVSENMVVHPQFTQGTQMSNSVVISSLTSQAAQVSDDFISPRYSQATQVSDDFISPRYSQATQVSDDFISPRYSQATQVSDDFISPRYSQATQVSDDFISPRYSQATQVSDDFSHRSSGKNSACDVGQHTTTVLVGTSVDTNKCESGKAGLPATLMVINPLEFRKGIEQASRDISLMAYSPQKHPITESTQTYLAGEKVSSSVDSNIKSPKGAAQGKSCDTHQDIATTQPSQTAILTQPIMATAPSVAWPLSGSGMAAPPFQAVPMLTGGPILILATPQANTPLTASQPMVQMYCPQQQLLQSPPPSQACDCTCCQASERNESVQRRRLVRRREASVWLPDRKDGSPPSTRDQLQAEEKLDHLMDTECRRSRSPQVINRHREDHYTSYPAAATNNSTYPPPAPKQRKPFMRCRSVSPSCRRYPLPPPSHRSRTPSPPQINRPMQSMPRELSRDRSTAGAVVPGLWHCDSCACREDIEERDVIVDGHLGRETIRTGDESSMAGGTRVVRRRQASIWLRDLEDGALPCMMDVNHQLNRLLKTDLQTANTPQGDRAIEKKPAKPRKHRSRAVSKPSSKSPRPYLAIQEPACPSYCHTHTTDIQPRGHTYTTPVYEKNPEVDETYGSSDDREFEEEMRQALQKILALKKRQKEKTAWKQKWGPDTDNEPGSTPSTPERQLPSFPPAMALTPKLEKTETRRVPEEQSFPERDSQPSKMLSEMSHLQQSLKELLQSKVGLQEHVDRLLQSKAALQNNFNLLKDQLHSHSQRESQNSGRTVARRDSTEVDPAEESFQASSSWSRNRDISPRNSREQIVSELCSHKKNCLGCQNVSSSSDRCLVGSGTFSLPAGQKENKTLVERGAGSLEAFSEYESRKPRSDRVEHGVGSYEALPVRRDRPYHKDPSEDSFEALSGYGSWRTNLDRIDHGVGSYEALPAYGEKSHNSNIAEHDIESLAGYRNRRHNLDRIEHGVGSYEAPPVHQDRPQHLDMVDSGVGSSDVLATYTDHQPSRDKMDHGVDICEVPTSNLNRRGSTESVPRSSQRAGYSPVKNTNVSQRPRASTSMVSVQTSFDDMGDYTFGNKGKDSAEKPYSPSPKENPSFERLADEASVLEEKLQRQKMTMEHDLYIEAEQLRPAEAVVSQGFDLCSICQHPHAVCVCGQGSENNNSDCRPDHMEETARTSPPSAGTGAVHRRTVKEWHAGTMSEKAEKSYRDPYPSIPLPSLVQSSISSQGGPGYPRPDRESEGLSAPMMNSLGQAFYDRENDPSFKMDLHFEHKPGSAQSGYASQQKTSQIQYGKDTTRSDDAPLRTDLPVDYGQSSVPSSNVFPQGIPRVEHRKGSVWSESHYEENIAKWPSDLYEKRKGKVKIRSVYDEEVDTIPFKCNDQTKELKSSKAGDRFQDKAKFSGKECEHAKTSRNNDDREGGAPYVSHYEFREDCDDSVKSRAYYETEVIKSPHSQQMKTTMLKYSNGEHRNAPSSVYQNPDNRQAPSLVYRDPVHRQATNASELPSSSSESKDVPEFHDSAYFARSKNFLAWQRRRSKSARTFSSERLPYRRWPAHSADYSGLSAVSRGVTGVRGTRSNTPSPTPIKSADRGPWGSHVSTRDTMSPYRVPDLVSMVLDESTTSHHTDRTVDRKSTLESVSSYTRIMERGPNIERWRYEKQKLHVKTYPKIDVVPVKGPNGSPADLMNGSGRDYRHLYPSDYFTPKIPYLAPKLEPAEIRDSSSSCMHDSDDDYDSQRQASPSSNLSSPRQLQENCYFANEGSWNNYTLSGKRLPPPLTEKEMRAGSNRAVPQNRDIISPAPSTQTPKPRRKLKKERPPVKYPKKHDCGYGKDSFVLPPRKSQHVEYWQRTSSPIDDTTHFSRWATPPSFRRSIQVVSTKRPFSATPRTKGKRIFKYREERRSKSASSTQRTQQNGDTASQTARSQRGMRVVRLFPHDAVEDYFADDDSQRSSQAEQTCYVPRPPDSQGEHSLQPADHRNLVAQIHKDDNPEANVYEHGTRFIGTSEQTQRLGLGESDPHLLEFTIRIRSPIPFQGYLPSSEPTSLSAAETTDIGAGKDSQSMPVVTVKADDRSVQRLPMSGPQASTQTAGPQTSPGPQTLQWFSQEDSTLQTMMSDNMEIMQRTQGFQQAVNTTQTKSPQPDQSNRRKEPNIFIGLMIQTGDPCVTGEQSDQEQTSPEALPGPKSAAVAKSQSDRNSAVCQDTCGHIPGQQRVQQIEQTVENIFTHNVENVGWAITEVNIEREIFVREQIVEPGDQSLRCIDPAPKTAAADGNQIGQKEDSTTSEKKQVGKNEAGTTAERKPVIKPEETKTPRGKQIIKKGDTKTPEPSPGVKTESGTVDRKQASIKEALPVCAHSTQTAQGQTQPARSTQTTQDQTQPARSTQTTQDQTQSAHSTQTTQDQTQPARSTQTTQDQIQSAHSTQTTQDQIQSAHSTQTTQDQTQSAHSTQTTQDQTQPAHSTQTTQVQPQPAQKQKRVCSRAVKATQTEKPTPVIVAVSSSTVLDYSAMNAVSCLRISRAVGSEQKKTAGAESKATDTSELGAPSIKTEPAISEDNIKSVKKEISKSKETTGSVLKEIPERKEKIESAEKETPNRKDSVKLEKNETLNNKTTDMFSSRIHVTTSTDGGDLLPVSLPEHYSCHHCLGVKTMAIDTDITTHIFSESAEAARQVRRPSILVPCHSNEKAEKYSESASSPTPCYSSTQEEKLEHALPHLQGRQEEWRPTYVLPCSVDPPDGQQTDGAVRLAPGYRSDQPEETENMKPLGLLPCDFIPQDSRQGDRADSSVPAISSTLKGRKGNRWSLPYNFSPQNIKEDGKSPRPDACYTAFPNLKDKSQASATEHTHPVVPQITDKPKQETSRTRHTLSPYLNYADNTKDQQVTTGETLFENRYGPAVHPTSLVKRNIPSPMKEVKSWITEKNDPNNQKEHIMHCLSSHWNSNGQTVTADRRISNEYRAEHMGGRSSDLTVTTEVSGPAFANAVDERQPGSIEDGQLNTLIPAIGEVSVSRDESMSEQRNEHMEKNHMSLGIMSSSRLHSRNTEPEVLRKALKEQERRASDTDIVPVQINEERAIPSAPPPPEIVEVYDKSLQMAPQAMAVATERLQQAAAGQPPQVLPNSLECMTALPQRSPVVVPLQDTAMKTQTSQTSPPPQHQETTAVNRIPEKTVHQGSRPQPMKNTLHHNPVSKQVFSPTTTLTVSNHVYLSPQHPEGLVSNICVKKGQGPPERDLQGQQQPHILTSSDSTEPTCSLPTSKYVHHGVIKGKSRSPSRKKNTKPNLVNRNGHCLQGERAQHDRVRSSAKKPCQFQSHESSSSSAYTCRSCLQKEQTNWRSRCKSCCKTKRSVEVPEDGKRRKHRNRTPYAVAENISCNNQPDKRESSSSESYDRDLIQDTESANHPSFGDLLSEYQLPNSGMTTGENIHRHMIPVSENKTEHAQNSLQALYLEKDSDAANQENFSFEDSENHQQNMETTSTSTSVSKEMDRDSSHVGEGPYLQCCPKHHSRLRSRDICQGRNRLYSPSASHHCRKAEKLRKKLKDMKKQQQELITEVKMDCVSLVDNEVKIKDAQLLEERMSKGKLKDAIVTLQKQLTDLERETWRTALTREATQQAIARDKMKLETELCNVQKEADGLREEKQRLASKLENIENAKASLEQQLSEARFQRREKELISCHQAAELGNYKDLVDVCHEKYQEQRDTATKLEKQLSEVSKRLEERDRESDSLKQQLDRARGIITKRRLQVEHFKMMQIQLRARCQKEQSLSAVSVKEKKSVEDKLTLETGRYSSLLAQVDKQNQRLITVRSKVESLDPNRLKQQYENHYQNHLDMVLRQVNDILEQRAAVAEEMDTRQRELDFQQRAHEANVQILQQRNEQLKMMKKFFATQTHFPQSTGKEGSSIHHAQREDFYTISSTPATWEYIHSCPCECYTHNVSGLDRHVAEHSHFMPHTPHRTPDLLISSGVHRQEPVSCCAYNDKDMLDVRLQVLKNRAGTVSGLSRLGSTSWGTAPRRRVCVIKAESKSYLASIRVHPSTMAGSATDPVFKKDMEMPRSMTSTFIQYGPMTSSFLPDRSVPSSFLPNRSVPSSFLSDRSVPSSFLPNRSVPSSFLPDRSVPSSFLPDRSVPSSFLPDRSVPSSFLPDRSVPSSFLPDRFVASSFLPDRSVASSFLPDRSVPSSFLPNRFVASSFLPDRSVASSFLPDRSVPSSFLPDRSVASSFLPDRSVPSSAIPDGFSQSTDTSASPYTVMAASYSSIQKDTTDHKVHSREGKGSLPDEFQCNNSTLDPDLSESSSPERCFIHLHPHLTISTTGKDAGTQTTDTNGQPSFQTKGKSKAQSSKATHCHKKRHQESETGHCSPNTGSNEHPGQVQLCPRNTQTQTTSVHNVHVQKKIGDDEPDQTKPSGERQYEESPDLHFQSGPEKVAKETLLSDSKTFERPSDQSPSSSRTHSTDQSVQTMPIQRSLDEKQDQRLPSSPNYKEKPDQKTSSQRTKKYEEPTQNVFVQTSYKEHHDRMPPSGRNGRLKEHSCPKTSSPERHEEVPDQHKRSQRKNYRETDSQLFSKKPFETQTAGTQQISPEIQEAPLSHKSFPSPKQTSQPKTGTGLQMDQDRANPTDDCSVRSSPVETHHHKGIMCRLETKHENVHGVQRIENVPAQDGQQPQRNSYSNTRSASIQTTDNWDSSARFLRSTWHESLKSGENDESREGSSGFLHSAWQEGFTLVDNDDSWDLNNKKNERKTHDTPNSSQKDESTSTSKVKSMKSYKSQGKNCTGMQAGQSSSVYSTDKYPQMNKTPQEHAGKHDAHGVNGKLIPIEHWSIHGKEEEFFNPVSSKSSAATQITSTRSVGLTFHSDEDAPQWKAPDSHMIEPGMVKAGDNKNVCGIQTNYQPWFGQFQDTEAVQTEENPLSGRRDPQLTLVKSTEPVPCSRGHNATASVQCICRHCAVCTGDFRRPTNPRANSVKNQDGEFTSMPHVAIGTQTSRSFLSSTCKTQQLPKYVTRRTADGTENSFQNDPERKTLLDSKTRDPKTLIYRITETQTLPASKQTDPKTLIYKIAETQTTSSLLDMIRNTRECSSDAMMRSVKHHTTAAQTDQPSHTRDTGRREVKDPSHVDKSGMWQSPCNTVSLQTGCDSSEQTPWQWGDIVDLVSDVFIPQENSSGDMVDLIPCPWESPVDLLQGCSPKDTCTQTSGHTSNSDFFNATTEYSPTVKKNSTNTSVQTEKEVGMSRKAEDTSDSIKCPQTARDTEKVKAPQRKGESFKRTVSTEEEIRPVKMEVSSQMTVCAQTEDPYSKEKKTDKAVSVQTEDSKPEKGVQVSAEKTVFLQTEDIKPQVSTGKAVAVQTEDSPPKRNQVAPENVVTQTENVGLKKVPIGQNKVVSIQRETSHSNMVKESTDRAVSIQTEDSGSEGDTAEKTVCVQTEHIQAENYKDTPQKVVYVQTQDTQSKKDELLSEKGMSANTGETRSEIMKVLSQKPVYIQIENPAKKGQTSLESTLFIQTDRQPKNSPEKAMSAQTETLSDNVVYIQTEFQKEEDHLLTEKAASVQTLSQHDVQKKQDAVKAGETSATKRVALSETRQSPTTKATPLAQTSSNLQCPGHVSNSVTGAVSTLSDHLVQDPSVTTGNMPASIPSSRAIRGAQQKSWWEMLNSIEQRVQQISNQANANLQRLQTQDLRINGSGIFVPSNEDQNIETNATGTSEYSAYRSDAKSGDSTSYLSQNRNLPTVVKSTLTTNTSRTIPSTENTQNRSNTMSVASRLATLNPPRCTTQGKPDLMSILSPTPSSPSYVIPSFCLPPTFGSSVTGSDKPTAGVPGVCVESSNPTFHASFGVFPTPTIQCTRCSDGPSSMQSSAVQSTCATSPMSTSQPALYKSQGVSKSQPASRAQINSTTSEVLPSTNLLSSSGVFIPSSVLPTPEQQVTTSYPPEALTVPIVSTVVSSTICVPPCTCKTSHTVTPGQPVPGVLKVSPHYSTVQTSSLTTVLDTTSCHTDRASLPLPPSAVKLAPAQSSPSVPVDWACLSPVPCAMTTDTCHDLQAGISTLQPCAVSLCQPPLFADPSCVLESVCPVGTLCSPPVSYCSPPALPHTLGGSDPISVLPVSSPLCQNNPLLAQSSPPAGLHGHMILPSALVPCPPPYPSSHTPRSVCVSPVAFSEESCCATCSPPRLCPRSPPTHMADTVRHSHTPTCNTQSLPPSTSGKKDKGKGKRSKTSQKRCPETCPAVQHKASHVSPVTGTQDKGTSTKTSSSAADPNTSVRKQDMSTKKETLSSWIPAFLQAMSPTSVRRQVQGRDDQDHTATDNVVDDEKDPFIL